MQIVKKEWKAEKKWSDIEYDFKILPLQAKGQQITEKELLWWNELKRQKESGLNDFLDKILTIPKPEFISYDRDAFDIRSRV